MAQEERGLLCEHSDLSPTSETHERCCPDVCTCSPCKHHIHAHLYKMMLTTYQPAIIHSKELKKDLKEVFHTRVLSGIIYVYLGTNNPNVYQWMNDNMYIHTVSKSKEILSCTTLVSLENILSEIRQYQNGSIFYEFMYMRYVNNQTHQTRRRIAVMEGWRQGW